MISKVGAPAILAAVMATTSSTEVTGLKMGYINALISEFDPIKSHLVGNPVHIGRKLATFMKSRWLPEVTGRCEPDYELCYKAVKQRNDDHKDEANSSPYDETALASLFDKNVLAYQSCVWHPVQNDCNNGCKWNPEKSFTASDLPSSAVDRVDHILSQLPVEVSVSKSTTLVRNTENYFEWGNKAMALAPRINRNSYAYQPW